MLPDDPGDIDLGRTWINYGDLVQGIQTIYLFGQNFVGPVAFVWGHFTKNDSGKMGFQVVGSFVVEEFRRQGHRTRLQELLFENFKLDYIQTISGTETGKAWMDSCGYTLDPITGHRTCTLETFNKALDAKNRLKNQTA